MNPSLASGEWLEADGLGGYAMGNTGLVRNRRYHALLCAAVTPPTGRMVLVAGHDAEVRTANGTVPLSAQRYAPDVLHPRGDQCLVAFTAEPWPTWEFAIGDGRRVRYELFVPRGQRMVVQRWQLVDQALGQDGGDPVELVVRPLLAGRDHHTLLAEATGGRIEQLASVRGVRWRWQRAATAELRAPDVVAFGNGEDRHAPDWYRGFRYAEEAGRGYADREDLLAPGTFHFDLAQGPAMLAFAAEELPASLRRGDVAEVLHALRERERLRRSAHPTPLHRAAESYLVARGNGSTLIAGYPWFTDWGRDTFLSLRGICHATGNRRAARDLLIEWAGHVSGGMLPNRFPDQGDTEYHTADAALWFVVAADAHLTSGIVSVPDAKRLIMALLDIVAGYAAGTRHGIVMDPNDGLLRAGEPGRQLTWMDAIVDGRVVTPRMGKPVELQALWGNALAIAARFDGRWRAAAERVKWAFTERFWSASRGHLHDVIDVEHVAGRLDSSLRCNQILAVGGLPMPMLTGARARTVVDRVERELLTPLGLRSLAPGEAGYVGVYSGGPDARDTAYHNGTVWPWLLGPFVEAWLRVHGATPANKAAAHRRFVQPLLEHLADAGIGHVSEIADGDAPHTPRGCPFQAWSLAELLRLELQLLADRETEPEAAASLSAATASV